MTQATSPDVFVYGTLMPGHLRWHHIEPYVVERWQDKVSGQLYDTGRGYPGARFEEAGHIPGWGLRLDEARLEEALDLLDEIEGPHQYERVLVDTGVGRPAWSYRMLLETDGMERIAAWSRTAKDEG
ncbi:MAG: gamma-glutamylcyclotransferase [Actinomycetota bacterium]